MSQTPREVIDSLLRNRPAERIGSTEFFWSDAIWKWVQQGYPTRLVHKEPGEKRWRPEDGQWEEVAEAGEYLEPVPPWEHFGLDMAEVGGWFDAMPLRGYDEVVAETDEWVIRRNGAGAALKWWKHKMGTPEHVDFRMTSREIWERDYRPHVLRWDPARTDPVAQGRDLARARAAGRWTHFGHIFVWELMRSSMGDLTLYQSLLLDPGWIHDYNRVYTDFFKQGYVYLFEQVGLPDGIWMYEDLGYKNGTFASPKTYAELIFPYYKEMVDFFHSYGLPVVLHTCGSVAQALPLIVEAGFDALHPMERKARGNDPFAFAEQYRDKLVFVGGLDIRILETNDRHLVRREVQAYIQGMKARGARLVFGSDHSITPNVDYDTYRYALDVYREHMTY